MRIYFLLLLFLCGCSTKDDLKLKQNLKGEYIFRNEKDVSFALLAPKERVRKEHPWERRYMGETPRITKEFFRCRGSSLNPQRGYKREGKEEVYYRDCGGCEHHGLPLRDGREFVYPCLVDLLNYVQEKTHKRVVITCGHRCPEHNAYCDPTPSNYGSKHMMGAEVDFYVEGVAPEQIVGLLQGYYKGQSGYEKFERYEKSDLATKPWFNKEIFIKLYLPSEGRDFDNQHPHAYIGLQVRYDRQRDVKVSFDDKASKSFLRY